MATIGQVAYKRPLARCSMEELAARQGTIQPSGGVLFARNVDGEEKVKARQLVIDLIQQREWSRGSVRYPGFHMITMPGLDWRFERKLLHERQPGWTNQYRPRGHYFTACENDRAIYYASVTHMPGLHNPGSSLKRIKPFVFAEMGVKTRFASFFYANIDDFMAAEWTDGWDVAWLDYTGPLTPQRLALIKRFYERHIKSILIVTALRARFEKPAMQAIGLAGGYWDWLRQQLDGNILHAVDYFDTSPIAQFAVGKS